jgi:DNA-binding transcriptional MocR family regulator
MPNRSTFVTLASLKPDPSTSVPFYRQLYNALREAIALVDRHSPRLDQAALADFIVDGHFARHIRRMRELYAERQAVLVEAATDELAGVLDVSAAEAGMHCARISPLRLQIYFAQAAAYQSNHSW